MILYFNKIYSCILSLSCLNMGLMWTSGTIVVRWVLNFFLFFFWTFVYHLWMVWFMNYQNEILFPSKSVLSCLMSWNFSASCTIKSYNVWELHNGLNLKSIMSCLISCNVSSSSSVKSYRCLGIASWLHNTSCIFLRNFLHNMVPKLWLMHKDLLQCIILDMRILFHFKIIFRATMDIMAIGMV